MYIITILALVLSALFLAGGLLTYQEVRGTESERTSQVMIAISAAVVAICVYALMATGDTVREVEQPAARTLAEQYPGEWNSSAASAIVQTLIAQDIRGCGEFHWKAHYRDTGDFLVYCTPDGRNWSGYIVWPNTGRVNGPTRPNPSIQPPQ